MEEKEERIFIRKGTARELCKFIYRDGCAGEMHCCSCAISIPRSEVIERMAKAICKISCACKYDACGNCTEFLERYTLDLAEAALNSLLEGK